MKLKAMLSVALSLVLVTTLMTVNQADAAKKTQLSEKKITLNVGAAKKLKLKNAKGKVSWSSTKKSVATVSKSGVVQAKKAGKATIKAKFKKKTYKCSVKVNDILVNKVTLNQDSIELDIGQTFQLEASYIPKNATENTEVKWYSQATQFFTVDDKGLVTAVAPGKGEILVEIGSASTTCKVKVKREKTTALSFRESSLSIISTQSKQIEILPEPTDSAMPDDLDWTSSDPSVASVVDGLVTGLKPGQVTITGTKDNCEAKCDVTITPGLFADVSSASVTIDQTAPLTITDYYKGELSFEYSTPGIVVCTGNTSSDNKASITLSGKKVGKTKVTIKDSKSQERIELDVECKDVVEITKEQKYETGVIVFVKNNGNVGKGVRITALFKDASGNAISTAIDDVTAIGPGEESVLFLDTRFGTGDSKPYSTYELNFSVEKALYTSLKSDVTMTHSKGTNSVIYTVQNNGAKKISFATVGVVYYKGGKAIAADTHVVGDIAPGSKGFGEVHFPFNDNDDDDNYEPYIIPDSYEAYLVSAY